METSNNSNTFFPCKNVGCSWLTSSPDCYCSLHAPTTQAKHFDNGKVALQNILAMSGIDDVANVGIYGAGKYGLWNFLGGAEWMRYLGSCVRHLTAVIRGEWLDKESGLPHLAHCAFNCLILLEWFKTGKGIDDRPKI